MTTIVKEKNPLVVPRSIQRRAGIKAGDKLEFKVSRGVIHIVPKQVDDEYTPAQRREIDAELEEAAKGPRYGPFTPTQLAAFLKAETKARSKKSK